MFSRSDYYGTFLKHLGVVVDMEFTMNEACSECGVEGHWRLSFLLRCRRFFALKDPALHYKSHILSYIDYRSTAITHNANVHLKLGESVQNRFLRTSTLVPLMLGISLLWVPCHVGVT